MLSATETIYSEKPDKKSKQKQFFPVRFCAPLIICVTNCTSACLDQLVTAEAVLQVVAILDE